jgi:tetratricopeptide (TPR) repeat protein
VNDLVSQFEALVSKTNLTDPGSSVEVLIASLKPENAWLLRASAIPHHFTPVILRVLAPQLTIQEAETHYAELTALPVCLYLEERVAIHDEARRYLFGQWLKPEQGVEFVAVSRRLTDHFGNFARATKGVLKKYMETDEMFHLLGVDQTTGFARFERLWTEDYLECGLARCKSLISLVREYNAVLTPGRVAWLEYYEACLYADAGEVERAVEFLQHLREHASAEDVKLQIKVRLKHAHLLGWLGQWERSTAMLHEALTLAEKCSMNNEFQCIWHELGSAYREVGELDQARIYYEKSRERAIKHGDSSATALALNGLGALELALGEINQAVAHFESALDWIDKKGDHLRKAEVYNNLGMASARLRNWDKAEAYYIESIKIKEQAGGTRGRALSHNNLVQVYLNQGKPERAIESANKATELFLEIRDFIGAAHAKCNIGLIHSRLKQDSQGCLAYADAAELFRKGGSLTQALETEKKIIPQSQGMPWWVWAPIIFLFLLMFVIL